MAAKINISIPQPCHENWEAMTSVEKGKFCNSCQKKVFDFTNASDREIVNAFQQNQNLCGRFLNTHLNRDLVKLEKKSSIWLATTTALISLVGLNEVTAQEPVKTEQTDRRIVGKPAAPKTLENNILVSGIVYGENKTPMPHLGIYIRENKVGETNSNGNFSITTHLRARIVFRYGDEDILDATEYYVKNNFNSNIEIDYVKYQTRKVSKVLGGITVVEGEQFTKRRTFFGRIFYRIGNLFR